MTYLMYRYIVSCDVVIACNLVSCDVVIACNLLKRRSVRVGNNKLQGITNKVFIKNNI